ncbi:hypothetical protein EV421DRAFT_1900270 [Armillaria borealis]|uniref:Uncharacterized protein n=1 Tax=Armillaria borealis TaxID=47425 RepID=A0AA39JTB6_9AGAR|nr:hypothetical protein EV421DRAFT_1900270 [Armillaria borealis]
MFPEDAKPKSNISPRTRLQGGFIMDCATAMDWASRIRGRRLTMEEIGLAQYYTKSMVVTRRLTFSSGYLGMDPKEIPRFHEDEKERIARELLKDEGLGELVFATRLD